MTLWEGIPDYIQARSMTLHLLHILNRIHIFLFHLKSFPSTDQWPRTTRHRNADKATLNQVSHHWKLNGPVKPWSPPPGLVKNQSPSPDQKRHHRETMFYTIQAGHLDQRINTFQNDSHISLHKYNWMHTSLTLRKHVIPTKCVKIRAHHPCLHKRIKTCATADIRTHIDERQEI